MKKAILIFIILTGFIYTEAQQLPLYSQYLTNNFLINPAVAGSHNVTSVKLTVRNQWTGFNNPPKTQVLSSHTRIERAGFYNKRGLINAKTEFDKKGNIIRTQRMGSSGRIGVGGYVFNDKVGPISKTGINFAYSYHIPFSITHHSKRFLSPPQISIGVATSLFQFAIDERDLVLFESNDPIISYGKETAFVPDLNVGIFIYAPKYFLGVSSLHILESKIKFHENSKNNMIRHFFANAGFAFVVEEILIEPSVLIKATEITPIQFDFNTKLQIRNISFAISYRTNKSMIFIFDILYGWYYFGYSYDYSTNNILNYAGGSHEIVVGINLPKTRRKKKK
ncbi:MAG: type IX secretion system membrane protein PorP/SprF [Bacteroidetes bacterium]|jgi:type IX secretion system PorP/SprF family membrane protein|nr:type IX secretion system membrane protein PorP/SprF [Bacteroidota bacterium]MBT6685883.1 type IX secretion system membrane protein PorP/SprF [Bacteroidota bacterium]MBT7144053.1 type IX secretion system membrane protein PorP/SprF [Bacteroidota bacterium]MBT7490975.1 type IX secretion system membrane protein PorP/SprF [Bacteroidota bacterium]